ncbi:MAG: hypothetical protein M1814_005899 [Vezdaea aestivalis]|nr:MAG: hypothetical protein M1814_005899 [Vezdaea aestivalis]
MSGRSAYVRKKNTEIKKDRSSRRVPSQLGNYSQYTEPQPSQNTYNASFQRQRSGTSISSNSELDRYGRRQAAVALPQETGIEKSALRSFMDSKSDKVRNKLASTITGSSSRGGELSPDPELWDPMGDTLVYFGKDPGPHSKLPASFRIQSSILEETESSFFITILREGYTYNNDFDLPPSPNSVPSSEYGSRGSPSRGGTSHGSHSDLTLPMRSPKTLQSIHSISQKGQSTPPSFESSRGDKGGAMVLHEIYFPAPVDQSKTDILRHHLTTRNIFALLLHKSLVGINLFQALSDLHERLGLYMPPESDNTSMIIEYIVSKGLDDVRNDPASAAGLLAWSEGQEVRWREGWREAFVNCAGMYSRVISVPESRDISPISKALLERGHLEMQVRIQQAEETLCQFKLGDLWPLPTTAQPPPARASYERFRKFLIKFYEHVYWLWPPKAEDQQEREFWLTRDIIMRLQRDFGALYDYLVDRDVVWDESEERSGRKWKILSKTNRPGFAADSPEVPMTDLLIAFDNNKRYHHIPHPFPIVPESIPPALAAAKSGGIFGGKKAKPADDKTIEKRAALAYSEATNIYQLGSDFVSNELVEAFSRFEKTDRPGEVDPFQARKGRWVLLYGVLQTLATLSVDTPDLRFKVDVDYFLSPRLRGTPPWRSQAEPSIEEANAQLSHCWMVPQTWINSTSERRLERMTSSSSRPSHPSQHPRHMIIPGLTMDGKARSSSEGESLDEGTQRARQWVNNGGDYHEDHNTVARYNQKEKIRDWPIPASMAPRIRQTRDVGVSDYEPPAEW